MTYKCYETFYLYNFQRKSITHLNNTINKEDKIIKKKYILNNTEW